MNPAAFCRNQAKFALKAECPSKLYDDLDKFWAENHLSDGIVFMHRRLRIYSEISIDGLYEVAYQPGYQNTKCFFKIIGLVYPENYSLYDIVRLERDRDTQPLISDISFVIFSVADLKDQLLTNMKIDPSNDALRSPFISPATKQNIRKQLNIIPDRPWKVPGTILRPPFFSSLERDITVACRRLTEFGYTTLYSNEENLIDNDIPEYVISQYLRSGHFGLATELSERFPKCDIYCYHDPPNGYIAPTHNIMGPLTKYRVNGGVRYSSALAIFLRGTPKLKLDFFLFTLMFQAEYAKYCCIFDAYKVITFNKDVYLFKNEEEMDRSYYEHIVSLIYTELVESL